MNRELASILVFTLLLSLSSIAFGDACYVPDDYPTIQEALDLWPGDTIIVRDGTWAGDGNKNLDFKGKAVTLRSENGPDNCIINCENDGRGFRFHSSETADSVLDGFTIKNGYVTGPSIDDSGGAIFCSSSPTINNCIITGNFSDKYGGGIYCSSSSAIITNCVIRDNHAKWGGGIACLYPGSPNISNCEVTGNYASKAGGGIHCAASTLSVITNCAINGNSTDWYGGGIYCGSSASPSLTNCTISENSALYGGGIHCYYGSSPSMANCILWGDSAVNGPEIALLSTDRPSSLTISYSDVEGGEDGVHRAPGCTLNWGPGNLNADPLLLAGPLGDYYLSQIAAGQGADSPCVDAGNDTSSNLGLDTYTTRTDHNGDAGTVDMGYHYGPLLTRISLDSPSDLSLLSTAPTFTWTADGLTHNAFAVDIALSPSGPIYSTYEHLHHIIYETSWTMPDPIWNLIPSGARVYWRVRGVDLDQTPLTIITSDEAWSFYKQ